ncbi:hypothetical protein Hamer_G024541 [Homarus americanus]|uniref:Uncharacterized protein n=1 Tax=Homarus americanus TaxID=6706 RepID=A0A8J5K9W8_HOMAM|nr:hypothetical protein Hamer_G024541 [Homarus americanus]
MFARKYSSCQDKHSCCPLKQGTGSGIKSRQTVMEEQQRLFKLRLRRDASVFADGVVFESTDGPLDFDLGKVYSGSLEDDELAEVEGVVTGRVPGEGRVPLRHVQGVGRGPPVALPLCLAATAPPGPRPRPGGALPRPHAHNFESTEVPVGPERLPVQPPGTSEPWSHSSISSSAGPARGGGAAASPNPRSVNPKYKAVTYTVYGGGDGSGGVVSDATPTQPTLRSQHPTPKKLIFDNKSTSFVNQFKEPEDPAGDRAATSAPHHNNTSSTTTYHQASAPHLHHNHLDFELVYEATGGAPSRLPRPPGTTPGAGQAWTRRRRRVCCTCRRTTSSTRRSGRKRRVLRRSLDTSRESTIYTG